MLFSHARSAVAGAASAFVAAAALLAPSSAVALPSDTVQNFYATSELQSWVVPSGVTQIYVNLAGAEGGAADNRGAGAELTGALSVTPGETLWIVVGGRGQNGVPNVRGGGGGGGSFIYTTADVEGILAAAGGGGGASATRGGLAATTTTTGRSGGNGGGAGGSDGAGGAEGANAGGGGGGGLIGSGVGGNRGGQSIAEGAAGGEGRNVQWVGTRGTGGYGGGGGTGSTNGGGGGGYSGGGGGTFVDGHGGGGGGGSSYFAGSLTGAVTDHHGAGFVTIYYSSFVSAITPTAAPAGASITIDGKGLDGATVTIGGVDATVTSSSDAQLTVSVPPVSPLPEGAHTIEVATAGGVTLPAVGAFTYTAEPTVTGVSPTSVLQGTGQSVTITGTNLSGATAVFFGDSAAPAFTVVSDTTITATVPHSLPVGTVHTVVSVSGAVSTTSAADELTVDPSSAPELADTGVDASHIGIAAGGVLLAGLLAFVVAFVTRRPAN